MLALNQVLTYTHPNVLARYRKDFPNNTMPADETLCELIKFLWLIHKHEQDKKQSPHDEALHFTCMMHEEMRELDDMWHTFLLFTQDYQQFCLNHFGYFIHHHPFDEKDKVAINQHYELELNRYLCYIHDQLGDETLQKWFLNNAEDKCQDE